MSLREWNDARTGIGKFFGILDAWRGRDAARIRSSLKQMDLMRLLTDGSLPLVGVVRLDDLAVSDDDEIALEQAHAWMLSEVSAAINAGGVTVRFQQIDSSLVIAPTVTSLATALWLQAAREAADLRFRPCGRCGKLLEVTSDGRQRRRQYCRPLCARSPHVE